ncbi:DUF4112 domain-containing protein [Salinarimonas sp.]|uniref:DUF4112 domain-containing protein n=1 Tax=Salinarimonas sp. TaxID=2766526 RepID=UPI00391D6526
MGILFARGDREAALRARQRLDRLALLLDSAFRIPFTRLTFGMDPIMSAVPFVGSAFGTLVSFYVVFEAFRLGAPRSALARMIANLGFDFVLGAVPVLGPFLDASYKANIRNVAILRRALEERER